MQCRGLQDIAGILHHLGCMAVYSRAGLLVCVVGGRAMINGTFYADRFKNIS
jgi:hypothetical protein